MDRFYYYEWYKYNVKTYLQPYPGGIWTLISLDECIHFKEGGIGYPNGKIYSTTLPISANRLHSLLSVMFRPPCPSWWMDNCHPLQWIDKPGGTERSRKRVLTDEEIKTIWPHLDKLRPNPRNILKLILLTAQRPGEIMSMRWEDIDLDEATWTQQTNKTDIVHVFFPLSP